MGRTTFLGEFEELMLTLVLILGDDAYGYTLLNALKEHRGRTVNLSTIHVTLYRLEKKGYLESYYAGATNKRGGRRKRYFRITNTGKSLLQEMKEARIQLWKLTPQLDSGV